MIEKFLKESGNKTKIVITTLILVAGGGGTGNDFKPPEQIKTAKSDLYQQIDDCLNIRIGICTHSLILR